MSFLKSVFGKASKALTNYSGDTVFLNAVASSVGNVILADGKAEDSEKDKARKGLMSNDILKNSFTPSQIDEAINASLVRAQTRAGRMENRRFIEAVATRPVEQRTDIFLISADVADDGGIGDDEQKALETIASILNVEAKTLLAA